MRRAVMGVFLAGLCLCGVHEGLDSTVASATPPQSYSLLGPPRRAGDLLRYETEIHVVRASLTVTAGQRQMVGSTDIKSSENEGMLIMGTSGRQLTKYKRKINLNRTVSKTTLAGKTSREVEHGALEGRTVMAILRGQNWHHSLIGAKENRKQKKAMLELAPPEPDTPYYPASPVVPGHTWKVQAKGLMGLFSAHFSKIKGSARLTFVKLHQVRRRPCARIKVSLRMRAMMDAGKGNMMGIKLRLRGYIDRALDVGLDLKMRLSGTIQMSGGINQDGQHIGMVVSGPFKLRARSVLRKRGRLTPAP